MAVRSSVARRLGLQKAGLPWVRNQHADGVVEVLLDATQDHERELTTERLFGWHAALFPTGYSGLHKIRVAAWRDDRSGPMRVVSGPIGRERIHYQAISAERLDDEMDGFLRWWRGDISNIDYLPISGQALRSANVSGDTSVFRRLSAVRNFPAKHP